MMPRWFGAGMAKMNSFPMVVDFTDDPIKHLTEVVYPQLCRTVKIYGKKCAQLNFSIGTVSLTPVQLVRASSRFVMTEIGYKCNNSVKRNSSKC